MKDFRILFIINYLDLGGAGKMIKYVANLCAKHIGRVMVLSFYEKERSAGLLPEIKYLATGLQDKSGFLERYKLVSLIRKTVKSEKPDVVFSFVSDVCFSARLATLGLKTKVVSAERGDPFVLPFVWKILVGWTYRHSDYCVFQLPQARDFFGEKVAKKSFVIPNVFVQEAGVTPFYGERKKTIVSAGRFVPEKRYEVLIEAFAKIHKVHPEYRLIIYGEGNLMHNYQDLSSSLGISSYISFPGYVKGIAKTIRQDGIFVLSSKNEGIPNSLIEALAVGVPCVATDCTPGGARFLTKDGKIGLLVPVDDIDALAASLISIIENTDLSNKLSKLGPSILSELSDDNISNKWIEAINSILK